MKRASTAASSTAMRRRSSDKSSKSGHLGLGHENKPRQNRIFVQQNMAEPELADVVAVSKQLAMNHEVRHIFARATSGRWRSESRCRRRDWPDSHTCAESP